MEKFKIICKKCGEEAKMDSADSYSGNDEYCGTTYTVECKCGESEEITE